MGICDTLIPKQGVGGRGGGGVGSVRHVSAK